MRIAKGSWIVAGVFFVGLSIARGGELKKNYFDATKPGSWVEYLQTSPDGAQSRFTYQRLADEDEHVVLQMAVKILAGPGQGSESKNLYTMSKDFVLARDGLSYNKLAEKMTMMFGTTVMPVDPATLESIRQSGKDYRGAVTFEATEPVAGYTCDRYAYSLRTGGPAPAQEDGTIWLCESVPFAIVRQVGRITGTVDAPPYDYEMNLQNTGLDQSIAAASGPEPSPAAPAPLAPATVGLAEGYMAGRLAIEVQPLAGSGGRQLSLIIRNKTDTEFTVKVPAGDLDLDADSPIHKLRLTIPKEADLVLPAEESAEPIRVGQRGQRGAVEGRFTLSVYEGALLYSGSATVDSLK